MSDIKWETDEDSIESKMNRFFSKTSPEELRDIFESLPSVIRQRKYKKAHPRRSSFLIRSKFQMDMIVKPKKKQLYIDQQQEYNLSYQAYYSRSRKKNTRHHYKLKQNTMTHEPFS